MSTTTTRSGITRPARTDRMHSANRSGRSRVATTTVTARPATSAGTPAAGGTGCWHDLRAQHRPELGVDLVGVQNGLGQVKSHLGDRVTVAGEQAQRAGIGQSGRGAHRSLQVGCSISMTRGSTGSPTALGVLPGWPAGRVHRVVRKPVAVRPETGHDRACPGQRGQVSVQGPRARLCSTPVGQYSPHVATFRRQRGRAADVAGHPGLGDALGSAAGAEVAPGRPFGRHGVVHDSRRFEQERPCGK